jgi:6-hydroxymethylpterin diphosphokinase MptE-like
MDDPRGRFGAPALRETMPIRVNITDAAFRSNIEHACQLPVPWLQALPQRDGHAVLVGGGPSLSDNVDELRRRYTAGQTFFAMNGSAIWLAERGMRPHYHVLLDARPGNVRFLDYDRSATHFLIASQCDPSIFGTLAEAPVTLWHPHAPEAVEIVGDREAAFIGGGTTVGMQANAIALVLGFRAIDLFGYDGSYRDDEGHAYAQPENAADAVIEVFAHAKKFRCARWMAHQAQEFGDDGGVLDQLWQAGCEVTITGDGLLPYIFDLRCNAQKHVLELGCDLGVVPSSFDFIVWLAAAEQERQRMGYGGLSVTFKRGPQQGFRADGFPPTTDERQQLFDHVVKPSLAMVGAKEGHGADLFPARYCLEAVTEAFRHGSPIPQLQPSRAAEVFVEGWLDGRRPVVITLREARYWPARNSDLDAWETVARHLKDRGESVIFVRDAAKADEILLGFESMAQASRDLHIRLALYQQAKLNLTVSTGPVALLWFSSAPFRAFTFPVPGYGPHTEEGWPRLTGFAWGEQAPWFTAEQKIVYACDTLENIEAELAAAPELRLS